MWQPLLLLEAAPDPNPLNNTLAGECRPSPRQVARQDARLLHPRKRLTGAQKEEGASKGWSREVRGGWSQIPRIRVGSGEPQLVLWFNARIGIKAVN